MCILSILLPNYGKIGWKSPTIADSLYYLMKMFEKGWPPSFKDPTRYKHRLFILYSTTKYNGRNRVTDGLWGEKLFAIKPAALKTYVR